MTNRFTLFKRGAVYYCEDRKTGKQESLKTRNRVEALKLVQAKNDAHANPSLNLALGLAYLSAHDSNLSARTWGDVMERFCKRGKPQTQVRHRRAVQSRPMQYLKSKKLIETTSEDFLHAMEIGTNSTIGFLKTLHNDAMDLGWLLKPVLPSKKWPVPRSKKRRAITREEHERILQTFRSHEWKSYLRMLWLTGASQTDAARLAAENVDWPNRVLSYHRAKLSGRGLPPACLQIGTELESLLNELPSTGPMFPYLRTLDDRARSCFFWKRCKKLQIKGISLHSYRYAWAERAQAAGYPERFAMLALGHNSKAVHRAYSRSGRVTCPSLEEFEANKLSLDAHSGRFG